MIILMRDFLGMSGAVDGIIFPYEKIANRRADLTG